MLVQYIPNQWIASDKKCNFNGQITAGKVTTRMCVQFVLQTSGYHRISWAWVANQIVQKWIFTGLVYILNCAIVCLIVCLFVCLFVCLDRRLLTKLSHFQMSWRNLNNGLLIMNLVPLTNLLLSLMGKYKNRNLMWCLVDIPLLLVSTSYYIAYLFCN